MGLLKFVCGYTVGFYTGICVVKNYNVPNIPAPGEIYNAILKTAEKFKKDKPDDWSITNVMHLGIPDCMI